MCFVVWLIFTQGFYKYIQCMLVTQEFIDVVAVILQEQDSAQKFRSQLPQVNRLTSWFQPC